MPLPTGYSNKIKIVTDDAASINAELAAQNAADVWVVNMGFDLSNGIAYLLLSTNVGAAYVPTSPQKVNILASNDQAALDADAATEALDGYVPTGIFIHPSDYVPYVLYQQLNDSSL